MPHPDPHQTAETPRPADRGRTLAVLLLVAAAIVGLLVLGRRAATLLTSFTATIDGLGPWGPAAFVLGYAIAAVAFVPGSFLTLAGGALFGLARGTAFVFAGATLGASAAFLIARHLARERVERRLEGREAFRRIDAAVGREGLRIVTLLRLSPAVPFSLLNYALGLTRVRFGHYLAGFLGMLPGTFLYVYYGKAVGDLAALAAGERPDDDPARWFVLGLGLLATLAVTWTVTRIARKALDEEVDP